MQSTLLHRFTRFAIFISTLALLASASARAIEISGCQAKADTLPGIFVMLYDPVAGTKYTGTQTEPLTGYTSTYSAFDAILDTGASGCVLSKSDGTALGIPLITGGTYSDVGIGGTEVFNISKSTEVRVAPMTSSMYSVWYNPLDILDFKITDNTENPSCYSSVGAYNCQVRQQDTSVTYMGYTTTVSYNILGTPVLNQKVMHVTPNTLSEFSGNVCSYMQAELLDGMPDLSTTPGVLRVALKYQNFVTNAGSVSTSTNPTIENISVRLGGTSATTTFLFDTGSLITVIGKNMATSLGITPGAGDYLDAVTLSGIGATTVTMYSYQVDALTVPLTNGEQLTFTDAIVYASSDSALPADLTGIIGMNLLGQSYTFTDGTYGLPMDLTPGAFSDWYVNPFASELVLTGAVPEPGTLVLLAIGAVGFGVFAIRRRMRRQPAEKHY